jgi:autotransporter-associated beta strand protein
MFTANAVFAGTLYWDTNGDAAGSVAVDSGGNLNTWGRTASWSTSADGNVATVAYTQDSDVVLAAGTNATGSYILRINGAQRANSITFEEGVITLSSGSTSGSYQAGGGSLSIGAGGLTLAPGLHGAATIANGLGTLLLTADQSWTNNTGVSSNTTSRSLIIETGVAGNATSGQTRILTITGGDSGANGGTSINGAISDGAGGGNLAIVKSGSQTLSLSGSSSYTGLTKIDAGIIRVLHNNALGSNAAGTEVAANSTLRLENNVTITGETLKITGTPLAGNSAGLLNEAGDNTWTGDITLISSSQNSRISMKAGTLNISGNIRIEGGSGNDGGFGLVMTGDGGTGTISGNITGAGNNQTLIKNGGSTWVLSGNNTYSGATRVDAGTLVISSFATNLSGSSAISLGDGGSTGTLRYLGTTDETVTRGFQLRPNNAGTGGGVIDQSGTAHLKITGNLTAATGTVGKKYTLQGSTSGTGEVTGNISDGGAESATSLTKAGTGTWTLSGTDKTYTGVTSVTGGQLNVTALLTGTTALDIGNGTLTLASADRLANAAAVTLRQGGNIELGGGESFGTLTVMGNATLDLSLTSSIVQFANSSSTDWTGGLLTILGWNGTPETGGGAERVVFGGDATGLTQVDQVQFLLNDGLYSAKILASGEIVPNALIPEPSAAMLGLMSGTAISFRRRRRKSN